MYSVYVCTHLVWTLTQALPGFTECVQVHVCACACVHSCWLPCVCVCVWICCVHLHMSVCMFLCTCVHVYLCPCISVCVQQTINSTVHYGYVCGMYVAYVVWFPWQLVFVNSNECLGMTCTCSRH